MWVVVFETHFCTPFLTLIAPSPTRNLTPTTLYDARPQTHHKEFKLLKPSLTTLGHPRTQMGPGFGCLWHWPSLFSHGGAPMHYNTPSPLHGNICRPIEATTREVGGLCFAWCMPGLQMKRCPRRLGGGRMDRHTWAGGDADRDPGDTAQGCLARLRAPTHPPNQNAGNG